MKLKKLTALFDRLTKKKLRGVAAQKEKLERSIGGT